MLLLKFTRETNDFLFFFYNSILLLQKKKKNEYSCARGKHFFLYLALFDYFAMEIV